jgi:hypothetical protein
MGSSDQDDDGYWEYIIHRGVDKYLTYAQAVDKMRTKLDGCPVLFECTGEWHE